MRFDVASAENAVNENKLETWLDDYLSVEEWANPGLRDGLKKAQRWWVGPIELPLSMLHRKCGPEAHMPYRVREDWWEEKITRIAAGITDKRELPPLIAELQGDKLLLADGNHRYEALGRAGFASAWVLVWYNSAEDFTRHSSGLYTIPPD